MATSAFMQEFSVFLENLVLCPEVLVVAGDFNLHMDDATDADALKFAELLETFGLTQHINFATHVSGHWLDLIITRSSNDVMIISPRPSLFLSDHCFAECTLAIPSDATTARELTFRKYKNLDITAFQKDITKSDLTRLKDNELAEGYDRILNSILDAHAPLRRKVIVTRPRVPWFNDELRSLKSKRRKLEKRMRKSNLDSDIRAYRVACNQYCFRLHEAKKKHYGGLIEECAGDSKKLFGVVKSLCNERTDALPPHDNPRQLADEFGEFFYRKIAVIREDIKNCSIPQPVVSIPSPPTKITHFSPVSETQVRDIISSSSNASCQLDPIPTSLLKKSVDVLAPIITRMVNSSLVSGCVPDNWKIALVLPLIKKLGLELVQENFRPVSNLPFVSKIAEKAVIPQVLDHCSKHAPLPSNQSSYRQHHSTETALLRVQNDILLSMDRQEVTLLVLLDLSAAFDTIDHSILADLLETDFGISNVALSWIKSFVRGRKQRVTIKQEQSRNFSVLSGVPQGSCLGPLLFIMYASRLFHVVEKHLPVVHVFADDTQLYLSFRPTSSISQDQAIRAMEECIVDVRAWMCHNMMKLNDSKTEFLIIGSRQQLAKINVDSIKVGASEIVSTSSVRNLGAWFDKNMSMDAHVGKVCSKAFFGLYKIRQIRKFLSVDATNTLVHAFVTSHVDYCNSLLYGVSQYQLSRLQRVLNAAARITCLLPRYSHITPTLFHLHWLPIASRIKFKIALIVYKALNGYSPSYITDLLHIKPPGRYAMRSDDQHLLLVPRTKCKTFGDRAFAVAGPRVWNSLPLAVRNSVNVDTFKTNLKSFLFTQAYKHII